MDGIWSAFEYNHNNNITTSASTGNVLRCFELAATHLDFLLGKAVRCDELFHETVQTRSQIR